MMYEKNFAIVLLSITIVVIAWVGFSVYHSFVTSTLDNSLTTQIMPIRKNFNPQVLDLLRQRMSTQPTYELDMSLTQTEEASSEAVVTPEVTATPTEPVPTPTIEEVSQ